MIFEGGDGNKVAFAGRPTCSNGELWNKRIKGKINVTKKSKENFSSSNYKHNV